MMKVCILFFILLGVCVYCVYTIKKYVTKKSRQILQYTQHTILQNKEKNVTLFFCRLKVSFRKLVT